MIRETVITAETIEEAKIKACEELGTNIESTQFEIIQYPEKKKFGLFGGNPAKVRAFVEVTPLETAKKYIEDKNQRMKDY